MTTTIKHADGVGEALREYTLPDGNLTNVDE